RQTFQPANPPARYNRGMPVRLIALDIDGTLLDSRWQVSEANRQAIAEAARRGMEVALVTGRRYDFAMPIARQLHAPLTMIVSNGALIRSNDGRTHLRHLLPQRVAARVLQLTKPWREGAAVTMYEHRDFAMIDVLNPVCSKGASLKEWTALRGFAREEVMAIGDNHNDLEMLNFAGIPVVMGNSVPELKTFGWHQTTTNDE